tara:strand:- start:270 stop:605 length:336 start_codon:yes stop_codon:yes gene_type:complete
MEAATTEQTLGEHTAQFTKRLSHLTRGQFFSVTFTKKDGTERVMAARTGVKPKQPKLPPDVAAERRANLAEKGMFIVWDSTVRDYRIITVPNILELKFSGVVLIERETNGK